jgi:hypothetical protein
VSFAGFHAISEGITTLPSRRGTKLLIDLPEASELAEARRPGCGLLRREEWSVDFVVFLLSESHTHPKREQGILRFSPR